MSDLTPDERGASGVLCSVETDRLPAVASAHPFLKMIWWVGAIGAVALMVFWLVRMQSTLRRLEGRVAVAANATSSGAAASPEVLALEARLSRVITASIESKLRRLEHSADRGALSGEDLQLLESATGELRLLRAQPVSPGGQLGSEAVAEHPRYRASAQPPPDNPDVLQQVKDLRAFVHLLVVSLALVLIVALGLWYNTARRVKLIASMPRRQIAHIKATQRHRRGV